VGRPGRQSRILRSLLAQAFNNAWANHRLLAAVAQLSDQDFAAKRTSFFPSLRATLNHNLTVDWFYLAAMERALAGQGLDPNGRDCLDPEEPYARGVELERAQRAADDRLLALCRSLADEQLDLAVAVPWSTPGREKLQRVLMHLFQHQIHHRGQAHAMLAGTPVAPPQLDELFCAGDAPRRAADLAELGWTEAELDALFD
jgi:uncharacterized damage-inducible protein DinB